MRTLQTKEEYNIICHRIEALLAIVNNDTKTDDPFLLN